MNLKELYQEIILDHGKNPRNLGKFENFNKDAKGHNPLCGDKVHLFLKLDENKKVNDISFEGEGCAISMASASIMTDLIKGKNENEVKEIIEKFLDMIKEKDDINTNLLNDDEKIIEIFTEIIQDLKNYELEQRISELESRFSKDMSETTFNEIKELKKLQKIN